MKIVIVFKNGKIVPHYINIKDISYIYKEVTEHEGEME